LAGEPLNLKYIYLISLSRLAFIRFMSNATNKNMDY
jgi:hypothetical protein